MNTYVAYLFDLFYDMHILVGVFSTYEKAEDAIEIVMEQKRKTEPENSPEGRYDFDIACVPLDGFNSYAMWMLAE